nr:MAG TPA: hypothetical protein [Crassvirales sp.]
MVMKSLVENFNLENIILYQKIRMYMILLQK